MIDVGRAERAKAGRERGDGLDDLGKRERAIIEVPLERRAELRPAERRLGRGEGVDAPLSADKLADLGDDLLLDAPHPRALIEQVDDTLPRRHARRLRDTG